MTVENDLGALIVAYLAARQRFVNASARADGIHKRLTAAAAAVRDTQPDKSERGFRSFGAQNENRAIKDVPSAVEILDVMTDWAVVRAEVRAAWLAIPVDSQRQLADPPKGVIVT